MTDDKLKAAFEAGMEALSGRASKRKHYEALEYPAMVQIIFSCEQCDNAFPLEDGPRMLLSEEHARQVLKEFSKDFEPRTIACSCGRETEYCSEDVAFVALPEK